MLYEQITANKRKTIFVIVGYLLFFLLIGIGAGYTFFNNPVAGILIISAVGFIYTFIMIKQSTNIVMRLNNAHEIKNKNEYPLLFNIVEELSIIAKVPMPKIYIINDRSPNAFATGNSPEHAAVAITRGLLEQLNREELTGVMAHEMGHIRNYDIRLQTIVLALSSIVTMVVNYSYFFGRFNRRSNNNNNKNESILEIVIMVISILTLILGPLISTIIQLALSRNREYLADATAVEFTRNPQGLISALRKIENAPALKDVPEQSAALYITNPFKKESKDSLFATHPTTENRIKRLEKM